MKKVVIIFSFMLFIAACNSSSTDDKNAGTKTADTASASATAPAAETKDPEAENGLALIAKNDCLTCHKLSEASVGPAYAAVAAKYKGVPNAVDSLAAKVIRGGSGNWGSVPMTPHPQLAIEDAKTMVHYVLSIK